MMKRFKELLAGDELIPLFATGRVIHPVVIEIFGLAGGYRGFWIDQEHVGVTSSDITVAALAGAPAPSPPLPAARIVISLPAPRKNEPVAS